MAKNHKLVVACCKVLSPCFCEGSGNKTAETFSQDSWSPSADSNWSINITGIFFRKLFVMLTVSSPSFELHHWLMNCAVHSGFYGWQ